MWGFKENSELYYPRIEILGICLFLQSVLAFSIQVLLKDISLVHAQTLASRYVPSCCHCTCSLISATDFFGDDYQSLSARAREVVARHWPDVTPMWCPKCSREMYCSRQCMEAAWEDNHQVLCPSVNEVEWPIQN